MFTLSLTHTSTPVYVQQFVAKMSAATGTEWQRVADEVVEWGKAEGWQVR